ncbi:helix-turn-helix domain-containing protein [Pontibacillus chungwhensis]|uniref:helix-turn-helix domain-containing protein n=1 Tax=Pontibacillus chungwhensis TaxID=265426 RepID=UPI0034DCE103
MSELAKTANVSKSYISQIERGQKENPSITILTDFIISKTVPPQREEGKGYRVNLNTKAYLK